MASLWLILALSLSQLTLQIEPRAGYAPLRVAVTIRVAHQSQPTALCLTWKNLGDPDDPTHDYEEESLSCQPVWNFPYYWRVLTLGRGVWRLEASLTRADGSYTHTPPQEVRVLANAADPR